MSRDELKEQLAEWRHYLHEHPESAFEEVNTAAFVAEKLREMGIEVETGVGKTGVVGTLKAGGGSRVNRPCGPIWTASAFRRRLTICPINPGRPTGCMPAAMTDIRRPFWARQRFFQRVRTSPEPYGLYSSPRKNRATAPRR